MNAPEAVYFQNDHLLPNLHIFVLLKLALYLDTVTVTATYKQ